MRLGHLHLSNYRGRENVLDEGTDRCEVAQLKKVIQRILELVDARHQASQILRILRGLYFSTVTGWTAP
jgi:hypothetical protein